MKLLDYDQDAKISTQPPRGRVALRGDGAYPANAAHQAICDNAPPALPSRFGALQSHRPSLSPISSNIWRQNGRRGNVRGYGRVGSWVCPERQGLFHPHMTPAPTGAPFIPATFRNIPFRRHVAGCCLHQNSPTATLAGKATLILTVHPTSRLGIHGIASDHPPCDLLTALCSLLSRAADSLDPRLLREDGQKAWPPRPMRR